MKTIRGKRYFKPSEVADLGLLKSRKNQGEFIFSVDSVLRIIREGKLQPINYCKTDRKYWLISEEEINEYNKKC